MNSKVAPLRILQVVTRRQRRGAEIFAVELSDALAKRGHDVLVVGLYEPAGAPLIPIAARFTDLNGTAGSRVSFRTLRKLQHQIAEFQPDIVQANGSDTLKYTTLTRRLSRGRWPLMYRNISMASRWLRNPLQRSWYRLLLRSITHVVSVSSASAQDFAQTYPLGSRGITVLPRAVNVPLEDEALRSTTRGDLASTLGFDVDDSLLMHVGSLSAEKNHVWLLRAFARIREHSINARLILVGEGPMRPQIEKEIEALQLHEHVRLLGSRTDAAQLIAAADLLLLTSLIEGTPGVILEAAAAGVPSVSTDVGGIKELVLPGVTGALVPSGDIDAFCTTVNDLLDAPARRRAMGFAARDHIMRNFELNAVAAMYEQLYMQLSASA